MSSGDLKEEYRRLQEQQQKKLERVKELRQAKEQQQQLQEQQRRQSLTFGINDDLGLQCGPVESHDSKAAVVEAELRDRIRGLDDENARLKKLVSERDFEMAQMRKKLTQRQRPPVDEAPLGGLGGTDADGTVAVKVMELSRKVRELTAEVESERAKAAKANRRVKEMESKVEEKVRSAQPKQPEVLGKSEREELEGDLRRTKERLAEVRTQQQTLTRELRLAKKALQEETGLQEANLRELLAGANPGQWRGRQQQIIALETQVRDLRKQLAAFESERQAVPTIDLVGSNGATTIGRELLAGCSDGLSSTSSAAATFRSGGPGGSRQHAALLKLQKERRERAEQERLEKQSAETQNADLKRKTDSLRARNQTLSSELKALKAQVETLLRKGKHDDELIESLTKRERALHELLEQNVQAKSRAEDCQRTTIEQVNMQKAQETQILDRMKEIVRDKEAIIQAKEGQIANLQRLLESGVPKKEEDEEDDDNEEEDKKAEAPKEAEEDDEGSGIVQPTFEILTTNGNTTSARKTSAKRADRPPSSRLSSARSSKTITSEPASKQRPPSSRPGSAGSSRLSARRSDPNAIDLEDMRTQLRAVEVERDRLRELLSVQDGRYQDALAAKVSAEQQLAGLRRRSATLERQANGTVSVAATADMTDVERLISTEDLPANRVTIQQLQEALAMCHEEVATRKQALKSAMDAKEHDVKWLMEIMEKTRQVYLSGIQRVKQQKG